MKYGKIIEGNLVIKAGDKNDYSEVERITGYLSIHSNAKLEASNLQSVGGYLYIDSNAKLEAPNAKFNITGTRNLALEFNFNCFLSMGFLFADRILAKIISKKTNKTNTVYKVQICGQTKVSYCVEYTNPDGSKTFAHGETIKQAKEDLKYKFKEIDTSMYKNYTLDTVITFEDAIQMYHAITGACSLGTKHFCENVLKVKKKKYTIAECIELTRGQYNSEKFREFFECQK